MTKPGQPVTDLCDIISRVFLLYASARAVCNARMPYAMLFNGIEPEQLRGEGLPQCFRALSLVGVVFGASVSV